MDFLFSFRKRMKTLPVKLATLRCHIRRRRKVLVNFLTNLIQPLAHEATKSFFQITLPRVNPVALTHQIPALFISSNIVLLRIVRGRPLFL